MAEDFIIEKSNLQNTRIIDVGWPEPLEPGKVRLRLDRFALSSNNITYAAFGESFRYWSFFPTVEGWGRLPVWGFATVLESACEEVASGERVFGFFPMSTHLTVEAANIRPHAWTDAAAHRSDLPPFYNQYIRSDRDPLFHPDREDVHMVMYPLFSTSFLLADFLTEQKMFGASSLLITSASSKTAIGTACLLQRRRSSGLSIVAMTSPGNASFVEGLGLYDRVVSYGELESLDANAVLSIDFSGDRSLIGAIHRRFGAALNYSCVIGATHWRSVEGPEATLESAGRGLPGPAPVMFHAPNRGRIRRTELGAEQFSKVLSEQWAEFSADCRRWLKIEEHIGLAGGQAVYHQFLSGRTSPENGYVISMT